MAANDQRERVGRLRLWLYGQLDPVARAGGLSSINTALLVLILLAVCLAAVETEQSVMQTAALLFQVLEGVFGVLFLVEYLARLWVAPENPKSKSALRARLAFVFSPASVFDILSIVVSFLTSSGMSPFVLRMLRVLRILRLAKLIRLSRAMSYFTRAIAARRDELFFSFVVGLVFLIISATLLYFVEGPAQPDKFGSIPKALWWAVATLTTIGYGDVYPITPLGKFCAAICAVAGIGLVAIPTGIMAAAFTEAQRQQDEEKRQRKELLDSIGK